MSFKSVWVRRKLYRLNGLFGLLGVSAGAVFLVSGSFRLRSLTLLIFVGICNLILGAINVTVFCLADAWARYLAGLFAAAREMCPYCRHPEEYEPGERGAHPERVYSELGFRPFLHKPREGVAGLAPSVCKATPILALIETEKAGGQP